MLALPGGMVALRAANAAPAPAKSARDSLPEFQIIPAAKPEELTPANGWPERSSLRHWHGSHGGPASIRYSTLDQINRGNVHRLRVAWTYRSGDGPGLVQCNPIIVDGVMFAPTAGKNMVALDAATGREIWRFSPNAGKSMFDSPARRGLVYWPGTDTAAARIIFPAGKWIFALHPKTGQPIESFGDKGRVDIPTSGTVGGAVWRNIYVVPGYHGDVFGYDVVSGRQLWRFHTIPKPGEFGAETWSEGATGANCWGGMALDEVRGIAYVATGSPKPNFTGLGDSGDHVFSNSVIALKAATGERLWHFQEVRHDIWNFDLAAPPNLVTVTLHGRRVDAVSQVTKLGNTLLLDRLTGKPLFPFRLRRAPESNLPGERTAPYQPDLELPQPFVRSNFTFFADHITNRTPEAHAAISKLAAGARFGTFFEPFDVGRPMIYYGDGGTNWPGASFDPTTGRLYITANEQPWIKSIARDDDPPPLRPASAGEKVYQKACAACHAPNRRGLGIAPPVLGLRHRMGDNDILAMIDTGRGAMPPVPGLSADEKKQLLDFLLARDRPHPPVDPTARPRYTTGFTQRLLDPDGVPGITAPCGTLNCLDLNTGRLVWRVPLGEYPQLKDKGGAKMGTFSSGGATTTAGGLVFATGTRDATFRAFDADNGRELWAGPLPHDGSTPPSVYEVGGREYVVVAAVGVRMLGGPTGDAWIAFSLP